MLDGHTTPVFLDLEGERPIATGVKQSVYQHPEEPGHLVKVLTNGPEERRLLPRYAEFRYGSFRPWHREMSEYLSILSRGAREIDRLVGFHGLVSTSKGPGLIVEKLTGPDGGLAPTLRQLVKASKPGSRERRALRRELEALLDDLFRARIIVGDLHAGNIVQAAERANRLVVIDGLGERTLLPVTQFSDLAYRISFRRRRDKLLRMVDGGARDPGGSEETLAWT